MTLGSNDLQSDEDLDSIRISCDVFVCVCVNIDILIYFVTCSEEVEY